MALRSCGLVGAFLVIALALLYLRAEQTRCASRMVAEESKWVELRRELWKVQTGIARLRAPARLHDSLGLFRTELTTREISKGPGAATRFASDRHRD